MDASINLGLIAPEISLLITAFVILLAVPLTRTQNVAAYLSLAGIVVSFYFVLDCWNLQQTGYFDMVVCDNFSVFAKAIFLIACGTGILLAQDYLKQRNLNRPEFYALILASTVGMMVMASSHNLMVIFLGLEIMSLPLYVLAGLNRRDLKSNESAAKYFFMGAFASGFFLYGIALVFGATGTTDLKQIFMVTGVALQQNQLYLMIGSAMVLIGFAFKIASFPFHMWVPDVYQGAPTPVTAFFSIGPKAAGIAAMLRIFMVGFGGMNEVLIPVFWLLAFGTMTIGNVLAVMQDDIKRMLAYSSIAHAGYLLVALTAGGEESISAALFYLLAYGFFNMGAFALVILVENKSQGSNHIDTYKGLARKHPWLAVFLALFMFSLAGFPPTAGFIGKFFIFSAAIKQGYIWLVVLAVLNSLVSVYYYLRPLKSAFFEAPDAIDEKEMADRAIGFKVAPMVAIVIALTAIGSLGLGVLPDYFLKLASSSVFMLM